MLDILTNAPREIAFGDRKLLVGALKVRELGYLVRWIRDHATRPSARLKAELEIVPEEDHRRLRYEVAVAERNWPPAPNTPQGVAALLGDPDGQVFFLGVMLRKFQPDLSDDVINEIAGGISEVDLYMLSEIAYGQDELDPKEVRTAILDRLRIALEAEREATVREPSPTGSSTSTPGADTAPTGGDSSTSSG